MITPHARVELGRLADDIEQTIQQAGIKARTRQVGNVIVHEFLVPLRPRPLLISARVALPGDEIGAGKVRKKIKKVAKKAVATAKKVAKSKAVQKLTKAVKGLAVVVPGLQPVAAGLAAAKAAKKVVMAAKKGNKKAKNLLHKAAGGARINLAKVVQASASMPNTSSLYLVSDTDGNEERVTL